jgi:hypothetical protein
MKSALIALLMTALTTACFDGSTQASLPPPPPSSSAVTADVVVRVTSNVHAFPEYRVRITCRQAGAQQPEWSRACVAINGHRAWFNDDYVNPACIGGMPAADLRVDGTLAGEAIHLRQSGMCGPASIPAWYALLRGHKSVPKQFRRYIG